MLRIRLNKSYRKRGMRKKKNRIAANFPVRSLEGCCFFRGDVTAVSAARFFKVPANRVVQFGMQFKI
jgi:hypothetical protein